MDASQFCAEYGIEGRTGRIYFTKKVVDQFITIYTHLTPADFTPEMRKRLQVGLMIDLYNEGYSKYNRFNEKDNPTEKIELPDFIFKI